MNFLISVIIPLYNKEKYIYSTLSSVLNQTFKAFEVIVIDDGSTDSSLEKLKKINDPRLRLISKLNNGVSSARNLGIKEAKGSWIAFIDADDIWDERYLEIAYKTIKQNPLTEVLGMNYCIQGHKQTNDFFAAASYNESYFKNSLERYMFNSSSVLVKKECFFEVGGFSEVLKEAEDLEMWYRLIKKYTFCYNPSVLSMYRKNSNVQYKRQRNINIENYWAYYIYLDGVKDKYEYLYLASRVVSLTKVLLRHNKLKDFFLYVKKIGFLSYSKALLRVFLFKKNKVW